ncbi:MULTISPECIES: alpha/beta hydrolase [unclassified Amycolatopsis]|uniref:alpha/beta hydrolase n=1 Tax=unclassified Amycolatopsis TaxID=2618356 RepID=UPI00287409B1|nr:MULTISPECIES: alpha/beta hydrolase [unclassified Amycolatopsis]MDS0135141.1 alpha/beta hydrolase [Amycolatopsis sp. 505]MDS0143082.1 alpha/beta hydrolase [Amycolatopsis sp. CM201R]
MARTTVTFDSAGITLAAHLHTPDTPAAGPWPALVVGHPGTGVKEQTAGTYARLMAERGFVTLAFDAAYQGESGGLPGGLEDPAQRVEDFKAAVSFLITREEVDADRIGLLGICASGGYSLAAAGGDHRVKAVATVSGADVARQFRFGADGTQDPAVFQGLLDLAAQARTAAARGDDPGVLTMFPETAEQAGALGGEHGVEGFEYYCTPRGEHERSAKSFAWPSVDKLASFDAFHAVPLIAPRPLLQIVGSRAVTSWMAVDVHQRATGPKELHWIEGASHVDLYDKKEYIDPAVEKLAGYFRDALAVGGK